MTACRNKARGAVVAALAGALTLGAAPVMALADGASLMEAADPSAAFSSGTVRLANASGIGATLDKGIYTISNLTGAVKPEVQSIKFGDVTLNKKDLASDDYKVYYVKADAEGQPGTEKVPAITEAGTYYVVVEAVGGPYANGKASVKVSVESKKLDGAKLCEEDGTAVRSYTYDAAPVEPYFEIGGEVLTEDVDYTVRYFKSGEDYNGTGSEEAPTDAGSYVARLTGAGEYAGSKAVNVTFTIDKYTLSADDVYVASVSGEELLPTAPTTVKGSEALASHFKLTYTGQNVGDYKAYNPLVELVDSDDPNVVATSDVRSLFYKAEIPVSFSYAGESMPEELTFNKAQKEAFKQGQIKVTYVEDGETKTVKQGDEAGQWSATVDDLGTDAVDSYGLDALSNPGEYLVTFKVNCPASGTAVKFGGSTQVKVTVISGTVAAAHSVYVSYDADGSAGGEYKPVVVSSVERDYDGTDLAQGDHFLVTVMNGKKKLELGTDFEVVFKDAEGKETSSVKDAGAYTLEVVGKNGWVIEDGSIDVTINKVDIQGLRVDPDQLEAINGKMAVPYDDGKAITVNYQYTTGQRDSDGDLVWNALSSIDAFTSLTVTKDGEEVKQVKDKGDYVATLALLDTEDAKNYELSAGPCKFSVAKAQRFVDVAPEDYFFDAVIKANDNKWVFGMNNSDVFAPNNSISRADVVVVLYRMAGGVTVGEDWVASSVDKTYLSQFSDVKGDEYYAQALVWAAKAGVVTGYEDGTFGGADMVTTEQFATMLARYAKLVGVDTSVDDVDATLGEKTDGAKVSEFARGAVAWALDNGYIGQGGADIQPQADITRGRAVTIAVRYQPERLSTPVVDGD